MDLIFQEQILKWSNREGRRAKLSKNLKKVFILLAETMED